jgi:predicted nucleic acid-binding Zn ribbon protein
MGENNDSNRDPKTAFKRRKKSKLMTSADVLQSLLQNGKSPLSDQFLRWKLWRKWAEVVGPTINEQTSPVGFDKGVLYIWVRNSSWMQHLTFVAQPLREKINTFAGRNWIRRIQFTLDRRAVPNLDETEKPVQDFLE